MKKLFLSVIVFSFIFGLSRCRKAELFPENDYDERLSGGSQTTFDFTSQAFSHPFVGMSAHEGIHDLGDAEFEQSFVTALHFFRRTWSGIQQYFMCSVIITMESECLQQDLYHHRF